MYNQSSCGCGRPLGGYGYPYNAQPFCPQPACPDNTGCPVQLDFDCVIYHKANNSIAALSNLSLNNGATLQLFAEAVDLKMGQLNFPIFALPTLRQDYSINTLRQFAEAVDSELATIRSSITDLQNGLNLPVTVVDTNSIDLDSSGDGFHTIKADIKVSAASNNLFSILGDGVYAAPQTLSINYTTKDLTISQGNSINLGALTCGVGGFLGNQTVDPSAIDGQYWFNTISNQLKIKLNGAVKVITTT